MKFAFNQKLMAKSFSLVIMIGLTACSTIYPPRDTSTIDSINAQMKQAAAPREKAAPLPEAVSSSLLPPIKGTVPKASKKQLEQRFDLVVTDAPINQVLMGIVQDTRYSIMVKPKNAIPGAPGSNGVAAAAGSAALPLTDRVTVNLKNVTMFEALDSIREVYGYDYALDGNRIYVQQPELQTRLYQINYIIGQRRGVSDIQVVGGASVGSSSSSTSSSTGGSSGSYSSVQATGLSTNAKSDVWGEVEDVLRTTLGCQIPGKLAEPATSTNTGSTSSSSTTNAAGRADVTFKGDIPSGARQRGVDGCTDGRAMSISQMSGTILVRAMPNEHRTIEKMLKSLQMNIERQVIIEAKIIDVELNGGSQQGINWAAYSHGLHRASVGANPSSIYELGGGGGIIGSNLTSSGSSGSSASTSGSSGVTTTASMTASTLGTVLGTSLIGATASNAFTAGLGIALQFQNFSALVNFLQTQGEVHVLSSPRIATMNSQKAVIKVGTEEPYVSSITAGTTAVTGGVGSTIATPPNLNYQPFFAGIALDVTPKIDDKGDITLHVHALVNSITEVEKLASPDSPVRVPFAVNTINETDSVVKAKDGQVIVIGGLMTERMTDYRGKTPGLGDTPGIGALFSKGSQKMVKRELVILLRPTVVSDDSAWNSDVAATQERIEALGAGAR